MRVEQDHILTIDDVGDEFLHYLKLFDNISVVLRNRSYDLYRHSDFEISFV